MSQDHLILIQPGFVRPGRAPEARFACPDCNVLEGLLATAPAGAAAQLKVSRVPFERPRQSVIELLGPDHQGLPVLVLGDQHPLPAEAQHHAGRAFVTDVQHIARLLAERYGVLAL